MTNEMPGAAASQPVTVSVSGDQGPGWLLRIVYFFFVGSWLSAITIVLAYLFMLTVVGLPVGVLLLNRLPLVTTLRPRSQTVSVSDAASGPVIELGQGAIQRPWLGRALYFVLIGWWMTAIYLVLTWLASLVTFGWAAFFLYNAVPALLTLRRN